LLAIPKVVTILEETYIDEFNRKLFCVHPVEEKDTDMIIVIDV